MLVIDTYPTPQLRDEINATDHHYPSSTYHVQNFSNLGLSKDTNNFQALALSINRLRQ